MRKKLWDEFGEAMVFALNLMTCCLGLVWLCVFIWDLLFGRIK